MCRRFDSVSRHQIINNLGPDDFRGLCVVALGLLYADGSKAQEARAGEVEAFVGGERIAIF